MKSVVVTGSFDDLRSPGVRFLEAASGFGYVNVLLWSDALVERSSGQPSKFPQDERRYLIEAIRYVHQVTLIDQPESETLVPLLQNIHPEIWLADFREHRAWEQQITIENGIEFREILPQQRNGFPKYEESLQGASSGRKKVVVTGCFDWLHSGHVRFFEEVSQLGDLYVVIGSDANLRLLKGPGHPLFKQDERRYMVQSVRYVTGTLISSGQGWMDAEPEINLLHPDIYAVNEDGDKPEKREFCARHGIEYAVLQRVPKEGLPRRESTKLRGF